MHVRMVILRTHATLVAFWECMIYICTVIHANALQIKPFSSSYGGESQERESFMVWKHLSHT